MERIEQLQAAIKVAEENLAKTKDEFAKVRKRVEEQQQGLEAEFTRVQSELTAAEGQLPEIFRDDYLRLARAMGADCMAPVEGESCGGCFTILSPQVHDLIRRDKSVFCKSCGRLLYLPE
jgi:predicted  nucleic acid-binding Zn-ribbon protein